MSKEMKTTNSEREKDYRKLKKYVESKRGNTGRNNTNGQKFFRRGTEYKKQSKMSGLNRKQKGDSRIVQ